MVAAEAVAEAEAEAAEEAAEEAEAAGAAAEAAAEAEVAEAAGLMGAVLFAAVDEGRGQILTTRRNFGERSLR